MSGWGIAGIVVAIVLVANESCGVSPWIARRLILLAVRLWTPNREQREIYMEEWCALIAERPEKLLKLLTAFAFLGAALWRFGRFATMKRPTNHAQVVEPKEGFGPEGTSEMPPRWVREGARYRPGSADVVIELSDRPVYVRDSSEGPRLEFDRASWEAFLRHIRRLNLDRRAD